MVQQQFDAVIIGSGAGGAPIAHELVKAGKSVLVLEKGPLFVPQYDSENDRSDFKRDELISDGTEKVVNVANVANNGVSYYSSHVEPDLNDEPHIYRDQDGKDRATIEGYTAQLVGGGTQSLRRRFVPLHRDRLQARKLQRRPHRHQERSERRCTTRGTRLADQLRRSGTLLHQDRRTDRHQRHSGEPAQAVQPRCLSAPAVAEPHQRDGAAGMVALADTVANGKPPILPYRTPLAVITRDHAPSGRKVPERSRDGEDQLCEPLRRPARAQIEHLGFAAARPSRHSRTSNCDPTALRLA